MHLYEHPILSSIANQRLIFDFLGIWEVGVRNLLVSGKKGNLGVESLLISHGIYRAVSQIVWVLDLLVDGTSVC